MASLEQLKFEGLHFPIYDLDDLECVFTIPFVHLEDVSESFIADISKFVYFDPLSVLRITRCSLPGLHNFGNAAETLVLEDISARVDLLGAVAAWEGENLWLDRCHSFLGMFLEALGHQSHIGYPCNEMRRLFFTDSLNFRFHCSRR
jgi:hypothetical protein